MKIALFAGLLSLTIATAAFAQAAPSTIQAGGPGAPEGGPGGRPPHFMKSDTNHDGFISKSEWRAESDARFTEIDTNHDGKLSPEEMKAFYDKQRSERQQRFGGQGGPAGAPPAGGPAPAGH